MNLFTILFASIMGIQGGFYDFSFKTLEGRTVNMSEFKGKKVLIFNSASKCGYTPQLGEFEQLSKKYGSKLVIIGFPSNEFMQEHKESEKIGEVCYGKYQVTFIMADRVQVNGNEAHPLFKWLTAQENKDFTGAIKWNFEKFLVDEKGNLVRRWRSSVSPLSAEITSAL
jgi:glutathione peroxidase